MKIDNEQTYKLTEFQGGFAIAPSGTKVNMPHAQDLVVADRNSLCEYLATYLSLREAGHKPREAHESAVKACKIQKVVQLS
jgi:hypothetical protein